MACNSRVSCELEAATIASAFQMTTFAPPLSIPASLVQLPLFVYHGGRGHIYNIVIVEL